MSYTFARISLANKEYLKYFYERNAIDANLSYDKHLAILMQDSSANADHIPQALSRRGVNAYQFVVGDSKLASKWIKETGISKQSSLEEILVSQLSSVKAEVVLLQPHSLVSKEFLQELRNKVKSIKLVAAFHCAATTKLDLACLENFDFVVTCTPHFLELFRGHGLDACLIYHAFEPRILKKITASSVEQRKGVVFTGSLWLGQGWHNSRMQLLDQLASSGVDIDFYLSVRRDTLFKVGVKNASYRLFKFLRSLGVTQFERNNRINQLLALSEAPHFQPVPSALDKLRRSPVFGLDMFQVLANSLACVNFHIDDADRYAGNIRLFEATGMGSCLITDWKENLSELFDVDKEIMTYRSNEECLDKVVWCAKNQEKARVIGIAGQSRTMKSHTIDIRAGVLDQWIRQRL
jgi:hypothetical protein